MTGGSALRNDAATFQDMTGYAARKDQLFATLSGTVLEIGAGTGANFARLPAGASWIGLEPDARLRRRLARNASAHGRSPRVVAAPAERIPIADASVDGVVGTVVLCSVADPTQALAEIRRVLRPGGRFLFFEHVAAAPGTRSRRAQRMFAPLSRRFDHGCDPSRATATTIARAGFADVEIDWYGEDAWLAIYAPFIAGVATN